MLINVFLFQNYCIAMFQLAEMRDMVRVPCDKFNLYLEVAVSEELDRKLSNKVSS